MALLRSLKMSARTTSAMRLVVIVALQALTFAQVPSDPGRLLLLPLGGDRPPASTFRLGPDSFQPSNNDGIMVENGAFQNGLESWIAGEVGGSIAPGAVLPINGEAELREGDSFLVTLRQSFAIPANATFLEFDFRTFPGFDLTAAFIPDAFEASLVDGSLGSVVPTWDPLATSFFNFQESGGVNLAPGVTYQGTRVRLPLSGVMAGTPVTLLFTLIGGDSDHASAVRVDNVGLQVPPTFDPPTPCAQTLVTSVGQEIAFEIRASDLDPLDSVTITLQGVPAGALVAFSTQNPANPVNGTFNWTPGLTDAGLHTLDLVAIDSRGASVSCQILIQVQSAAPTFVSPSRCGAAPIGLSVGVVETLQVSVADQDLGDVITLDVTGLPPGAVLVPPLPIQGNPASTTMTWTATHQQAGQSFVVTFTATDLQGNLATCVVTYLPAECFLVINTTPGFLELGTNDPLLVELHGLYVTPVTVNSIPSFFIPNDPSWLGLHFYCQILMHNAAIYPLDPVRVSNGLDVLLGATAIPYGTGSGLILSAPTPPLPQQVFTLTFFDTGL